MVSERSRRRLNEPHPARLGRNEPRRDEILAAHQAALEANAPGYIDPISGLFVFTAAWLTSVGECCDRGCRHCPYIQ
jgi:Family of unknown function (DUF5522)